MNEERAKQLLENLTDVIAEEFDLAVLLDMMKKIGCTEEELKELGYSLE